MNVFRTLLALLTTVAIVWTNGALAQPVQAAEASGPSQTRQAPDHSFRPIRDRYIVVFKSSVSDPEVEAANQVGRMGGTLHFTYSHALRGFAATLPPQAASALARNPRIASIEQDQTVTTSATQSGATWGLDRIDQRNRPLSGTYQYNSTGAGVFVFVLDTGVRSTHADFGRPSRVLPGYGYTTIQDGRGTEDCNGHGTHVAGTVGGKRWGVAKSAFLVPIRVLNCNGSGTLSGVIAGIDFVTGQRSLRPAVANLSLNTGPSSSLDSAVGRAVDSGVTMVVAAGNRNVDACTSSPARQPKAITVAATTSSDARASFSNFGKCVDMFAPGNRVTSTWHSGDSATRTLSGTSMATPHVAGAAALLLETNSAATPAAVASKLVSTATANRISSAGSGSPNLLLYSLGRF